MPLFDRISRLNQLDLVGRRVFLRADLNVSLSPYGAVLDDAPLRALLPTLRVLLAARCRVIVAGHYPSDTMIGEAKAVHHLAQRLGELLATPVSALALDLPRQIRFIEKGEVAVAPDLSRYPEEAANDPAWALALARSIDVYVNDAVRASREPWASLDALPRTIPSRGAGLALGAELDMLETLFAGAVSPYTAVVGGGSVLAKAQLLNALLFKVNSLLLGGMVANTFLVAEGWDPGSSAYEPEGVEVARQILATARARGIDVRLPVDAIVAWPKKDGSGLEYDVRAIRDVAKHEAVVDIALHTSTGYRDVLTQSASVFWNGPMGECKDENTRAGTYRIAQAATEVASITALVGDDTAQVSQFLGFDRAFLYRSMAGDVALSFLAGQIAPGIESLRR